MTNSSISPEDNALVITQPNQLADSPLRLLNSVYLPRIDGVQQYINPRMFEKNQAYIFRFGSMLFCAETQEDAIKAKNVMEEKYVEPKSAELRCPQCQIPLESKITWAFHCLHECQSIPIDVNEYSMQNIPIAFFLFPKAIEILELEEWNTPGKMDLFDPNAMPYGRHVLPKVKMEMSYERSLYNTYTKLHKENKPKSFLTILKSKYNWVQKHVNAKDGKHNRPEHSKDERLVPTLLYFPFIYKATNLMPMLENAIVSHDN